MEMCCGYSLEAPHWGASNEYPQHLFSWRNKKNSNNFGWKKTALPEAMAYVLRSFSFLFGSTCYVLHILMLLPLSCLVHSFLFYHLHQLCLPVCIAPAMKGINNIFLISPWKHMLWYSLEVPNETLLMNTHKRMFSWKNKKNTNNFV